MKYLLTVWLEKPIDGRTSDKILLDSSRAKEMFNFQRGDFTLQFPIIGTIHITDTKAYSVVFVKKGPLSKDRGETTEWNHSAVAIH